MTVQEPDVFSMENKMREPNYLLLSTYDSTGRIKTNVPNDFIISSAGEPNTGNFGGFPILRDVNGMIVRSYNFDITRFVQGIVTRKDSAKTLFLSAPANDSLKYTEPYPIVSLSRRFFITTAISNNIANGRVRLGGGGLSPNNPYRMRLRIIYSRI
jgi:hypothetical protein